MSDPVPDAEAPWEGASEHDKAPQEGATEPVVPEPEHGSEPDPAAPAPLGVPRTPTGNADVDAALDRLGDADHLATDGHVEVYEDVHQGLRDTLTGLDARPGPPAPSPAYRQPSHPHPPHPHRS